MEAHFPNGIAEFADPDAPIGKLTFKPSELAFLVVAPTGRMVALRACLESLQEANRFNASRVLVSLGQSGFSLASEPLRFGVRWGPILEITDFAQPHT